MVDKAKILEGRKAVDAYRATHALLYAGSWHKGIPEEHTPLLNVALDGLKRYGFDSIGEFFDANTILNLRELGLEGKVLTKEEMDILDKAWR